MVPPVTCGWYRRYVWSTGLFVGACGHFLPSFFFAECGVASAHVGAFEFEIPGGAGETAQGTVGDELAAGPHVPLLGFALAGAGRGAGRAACLHDLEDEDAVRRVGRRGREIVQDRQVDALEFVDLPVVGGLAVELGAVDFPGACPACARIVWGFPGGMRRCRGPGRSWLFPLPVPGDDDQGLPVTHPLAGGEAFDPVAAGLAFGWDFRCPRRTRPCI